ncbi:MAG: alpha/beta fold hydrolase [Gemmatimonadetes bacterium]|nr:MAG: alpha/beta fold hydrolase [Gemmatimonadota bacterium]
MKINMLPIGLLMWFSIALTGCTPYKNVPLKMEFADLQYPFAVQYADIETDIRIAYVDEGSGSETILFVHGLGSYLPAWHKNIQALRSDYRCIAVDLPGYGKSSKGAYPITMEWYADILVKFMAELKIDSAILAGHSMGGQIAMIMALKYPEQVERLILVAPAGFEAFSEGEKEWFRENITARGVKLTPVQQIRANLVHNFYNMPPDAEFMVTDRIALRHAHDFDAYCYTIRKCVTGMVDQPVLDVLDALQPPTLIVFGQNDQLIPNPYLHGGRTADIANIGAQKIPNSTLVLLADCGHFAQYEQADAFNQAVRDFLK